MVENAERSRCLTGLSGGRPIARVVLLSQSAGISASVKADMP